ncbi:hypothetical protein EDD21DRAFT_438012, partial [Dissophora ornata]
DLPTEIQLLVLSKLDLLELHQVKLINKRFYSLANADQLWKRLTTAAEIDSRVVKEAQEVCGSQWTWQRILRAATLIDRENKRVMQGTIAQMALKISQVREALLRQTQVLEETHNKLELLSGRLSQMEQQTRSRELERVRLRQREAQRLEDERWMREWDKLHIVNAAASVPRQEQMQLQQQGESSSVSDSRGCNNSGISNDMKIDLDIINPVREGAATADDDDVVVENLIAAPFYVESTRFISDIEPTRRVWSYFILEFNTESPHYFKGLFRTTRAGFDEVLRLIEDHPVFHNMSKPAIDGEVYFDRKKVCDVDKRIIAFGVGRPSSTADSTAFQRVSLYCQPEDHFSPGQYLIADSAYGLSLTCIPAYKAPTTNDPLNSAFNTCLAKSRVRSEHSIGILKAQLGDAWTDMYLEDEDDDDELPNNASVRGARGFREQAKRIALETYGIYY